MLYPFRSRPSRYARSRPLFLALLTTCALPLSLHAQVDQGTISGTVEDPSGAVVPGAAVTITSVETGLVLNGKTDSSGVYTFSPVKIGHYNVTVTAPNFDKAMLSGLMVNVSQRLEANVELHTGDVSQTVTVQGGAEQALQTEQASTGQVVSAQVINDTPLNGRNFVFVAQLAAGVTQSNGSRGEGNGDFSANGLRAEQNNFILDGIDNNSNLIDFLNGATYVVRPPPDALAEFKVQTSDYTAELGHSAGAVLNASIKAGTNQFHGNLWEYWRNDALDALDYFAQSKPEYRQNQFGGTIGGPILKNKLFFFGDVEANRIVFGSVGTYSVPTALMRQGDFSELLNTSLTGSSAPTVLYQPGSNGTALLACNGQQNVFCAAQINPIAQRILNLYPAPNANGRNTYNNYITNINDLNNTVDWDGRIDWNASQHDQAFFRMSYLNTRGNYPAAFGPVLDGGGYGSDGPTVNAGQNYALSETHIFTPTLANEFRFGYNWAHAQFLQQSANTDVASEVGLGGIPFQANNGGLPSTSVSGITSFGSPGYYPSIEYENVFQILDNVTKVIGNNTFRAGVSLESVRVFVTQPIQPHGAYNYNGFYTSNPNLSFTGYGVADFLADSMRSASLSNYFGIEDVRWYDAGYLQDDWKVSHNLTMNLGLRYDWYQPAEEQHDHQAYFTINSINGPGSGTGTYLLPKSQANVALAQSFQTLTAGNNINIAYSANRSLAKSQFTNFSPRLGLAYQITPKSVARLGYGIFFGGLESAGGSPNPSYNYPYAFSSNFTAPSCTGATCPTDGITLANGYSAAIAAGIQNFLSTPGLVGGQLQTKTPYTEQYNASFQYAFSRTLSLTTGYVGNVSRHLQAITDQNAPVGLVGPSDNSQTIRPFNNFGGAQYDLYEGVGSYNSLQTTLEKQTSNGLYFLATYTYSHALDDTGTPLDGGTNVYRNANLYPIGIEYTNSDWDVRHRFTFTGDYALPFGKGRQFLNHGGLLNEIAGGWSTDLVFYALTGNPFTVTPNNTGANGANTRRAILVGDPYAAGGTPDASNASTSCATSTRNIQSWFNPCAFANPLSGSLIPNTQTAANPQGTPITSPGAAAAFFGGARNQIYGPGYQRINMSAFKNFDTIEGQYLQLRADIFNLFNTPAFGQPSGTDNTNGGVISSTRSLGSFTPNSRFFQLAAKYYF
ncbi:TonB-dependent receptor [Acidipila sp. EB88]|uniref:TonB-dependent receptor n=1 Tax=Acidipila sp. EB88 TaxID=2305226 RepID=UPI000F5E6734|nr:carboxypeptidase regulatory-like domain-containing protein [Acidipila sp. EB88]RRA47163.1 TonB-dependent receptor [Acidipila sp. EB88]